MAFVSLKMSKAPSKLTSEPVTPVEQRAAPKFHKPADPCSASESSAEGFASTQHRSGSESEWEHEALRSRCGSCLSAPTGAREPPTAEPRAPSAAWVSSTAAASPPAPEEAIRRAVRVVLNKLTAEKFECLYKRLASCLTAPEHLSILLQQIFERAGTQHEFLELYADLCARLGADPRPFLAQGTSFKHLLLTHCQFAFERLLLPKCQDASKGGEDQQELEHPRRQYALGNLKLVGHLMVRGTLSWRLLVACCDALLRGEETCPEALESLVVLLTVTGKTLDEKTERQCSSRLSAIFAKIEEFTRERRVPARSRCLLLDLLDMRAAGWPHARPNDEGLW